MKRTILAAVLVGASTLHAQSVIPNNPGTSPVTVIRNATIHPVTSAPIGDATILFSGGRITAVGRDVAVPSGAREVDGTGLHVYPGMIDSGTRIGITEIGAVRGTNDVSELGDFNPNSRVAVALNPHSNVIPVTRVNGVTTVVTRPEGGIIAGQSALVRLAGWTPQEMVIRDGLAMHIRFPAEPRPRFPAPEEEKQEKEAQKKYEQSREGLKLMLRDARAYAQALRSDRTLAPGVDRDLALEALVPVVRGEMPVIIHAEWERDIRAALEFAREENLEMILAGGADVQRVIEPIRSAGIPVILGEIWKEPLREDDPYDQIYTNAAALHAAGIPFALQTEDSHNVRNLPYQAAACAAFGLPKQAALEAITINPARIFGVDDRLGSLEAGKAATLILTDGDPLDLRTNILAVFIDGEEIAMESYHTLQAEKFEERNRRVTGRQ